MGNTATLVAAANLIRANTDLLARHGYSTPTVIASIISISRNYEYNPMAAAVLAFADRISGVATGLDRLAGVTVRGSARTGLSVSVPVGVDLSEANALHALASDLRMVGMAA